MTDDFYLRIYLTGWGTRNEYSLYTSTVFEGACCFGDDGGCADVSESICNTVGGTWLGSGANCNDGVCDPNNCPTDINGDGYVNVSDLLAVIDQWGLTDSPADVTGDGVVNVSDILLIISSWGPCQ